MQSSRGQINGENLKRQDRSFVEEYAVRYDLPKSLPTEEIISKIFIKGRKTIPILQQHIWEGDQDRVNLTGRIEMPEHEEFLAHDRLREPSSSRLLPETFPPPPEDTYSSSTSGTPAPSDPASADTQGQGELPLPPSRMAFVYPPLGRPHHDTKGRVLEGQFDPLPENWLQEMLLDFGRGRDELTSDIKELERSVKETSYQVLNLCTEIKSERKDIKIFLDAIEKICGDEILNQIKADARATVLASRKTLDSQNQTDNNLPQGRVRVPANRKKKEILGTDPLPAPSCRTPTANPGIENISSRKSHSSRSRPVAPKTKRSFEEIDDRVESSNSSDTSSNRNRRTRREARVNDDGGGGDDGDGGDDSAPKPGGFSVRQPVSSPLQDAERRISNTDEKIGDGNSAPRRRSEGDSGNQVIVRGGGRLPQTPGVNVTPQAHSPTASRPWPGPPRNHKFETHSVQPVYGPDAHHLLTGVGNSRNVPGPSTTSAAPRLGRPLTRQYNVWFSLEDPPNTSSTSPAAGATPETTGQTASNSSNVQGNATAKATGNGASNSQQRASGTPERLSGRSSANQPLESRNQAESSTTSQTAHSTPNISAVPIASTSAAAPGSSLSSLPHSRNLSQAFRKASWNPPAPAPSHLRRRPLRREYESIAVDPITNRIVAYDRNRDAPDFAAAREAQAVDDVATIRRLVPREMDTVVVADPGEELDFMDEEEEEVVLGDHDDLPV